MFFMPEFLVGSNRTMDDLHTNGVTLESLVGR